MVRPKKRKSYEIYNELWKKYDIMDLFDNTITCIEYREEIEKPCKVCYFCSEKKWAFGKYDGGIV